MSSMKTRKISLQDISREWLARGFSCESWEDAPGTCWENYRHDVDELWMCLQGTMELQIDQEIIHPDIGDEVLIPSGVIHSVRTLGNQDSIWLYGYRLEA